MKKIACLFLSCFIAMQLAAQTEKRLTTYLQVAYTNTIHDQTLGNNPWGIGLGLQTFINTKTIFKPTIEITGDIYLADDKIFRTTTDGVPLNDVGSMVNIFAGTAVNLAKNIYLSFVAGPSFAGGQTLLGIKPSVGFYFSNNHKWMGKFSYINIFNRGEIIKENFSSISVAIGTKLF